jgi:hypothetical protein
MLLSQGNYLVAIASLGHHLNTVDPLDKGAHPRSHKGVVVHYQYSS